MDLLFWAAGFAGHTLLFAVLFIRRRARHFPLFTAFVGSALIRTIALFEIQRHGTKADYFYSYWSLAVVDAVLQAAVVFEIAYHVFRPGGRWATDVRRDLTYWVAASILSAGVLTLLAAPSTSLAIQRVMIEGNFFTSVLMSELLAGMIFLSLKTGLPLRTHAARISEGFGLYSFVEVIIETAHTYFGLSHGDHAYVVLSHIRMAAYLVCLTFWIFILWMNVPVSMTGNGELDSQLRRIREIADRDLSVIEKRARR
ncbi:hypothetical protein [Silvibacterium sp.]|uniref:hypothetical protein n=1 Tax=Silvibacterium sp. TaxID=1964179 RepID=UPI0039E26100